MTVLDPPTTESGSPADPGPDPGRSGRQLPTIPPLVRSGARWVVVLGSTLVIFAAFLIAKGADVVEVYRSMWETAVGSSDSIGETFLRATPLLLAALATAVPAKAGLFNLGGEGQLLLGAVGSFVFANMFGGDSPTVVTLVWMGLGGAIFGAGWALVAALLNVYTRTNEAIASLLLNYIAGLIVTWLCFEPWKDPASLGQAYSRQLEGPERFPIIWGNRVHAGIFVAVADELAPWWAEVDALVLPTVPFAPTVAEVAADPVGVNFALGRNTTFANLLGLAAITMPAPVGVGGVTVLGPDSHRPSLAQIATVLQ